VNRDRHDKSNIVSQLGTFFFFFCFFFFFFFFFLPIVWELAFRASLTTAGLQGACHRLPPSMTVRMGVSRSQKKRMTL